MSETSFITREKSISKPIVEGLWGLLAERVVFTREAHVVLNGQRVVHHSRIIVHQPKNTKFFWVVQVSLSGAVVSRCPQPFRSFEAALLVAAAGQSARGHVIKIWSGT